ncbi:MAG: DUF1810 domain-containing protein [Pseudomonadota bacterium]
MEDPFNLQRFVDAQEPVFDAVLAELKARRKESHWMWFIFPQLRHLGRSERALFYGLAGAREAMAYLAHPLLGPRLLTCTELMLAARPRSAFEVLGSPDDLKFRSCLTLFAAQPEAPSVFSEAVRAFFEEPDVATIQYLKDKY